MSHRSATRALLVLLTVAGMVAGGFTLRGRLSGLELFHRAPAVTLTGNSSLSADARGAEQIAEALQFRTV